jgi:hypothetical protein
VVSHRRHDRHDGIAEVEAIKNAASNRIDNSSRLNPRSRDSCHSLKASLPPIRTTGNGGSIMRNLFILVAVVFALVSVGAATVVTTALTSDAAIALGVR